MAVGAVVARILTQYSDKGSKQAKKDITKLGKQFDAFAKKTAKAFAVAAAAVAAFAVKVGKDAVQAAIADQKSQVLLANSLRNTTGATNAAIGAVEAYISKLQLQVGVADDELRPALAKLAAVTGSVADAQQLLGVALDVSAFSGSDLGSATSALTRALQGNFRSLQKLVPSIDATAIKSKDLSKVFAEVQKATAGAAGARANTLEYRLAILRIRYSEILETLGYKLLPVIEKFAKTIQTDVLPQLEAWISANSDQLVTGLQAATDAAIKLLKASIEFGRWIVDNITLIRNLAVLMASLWAAGKVVAFASAITKLVTAFKALRTAAAGAAVAAAFATGGTSVIAATAALATVGGAAAIYTGLKVAGNNVRSERAAALAASSSSVSERGRSAVRGMRTRGATSGGGSNLNSILGVQNILNSAKNTELKTEEKIVKKLREKYGLTIMTAEIEAKATAYAIEQNLKRQSAIAKVSPTVSLASQGNGSAASNPIVGSGTPNVTVNITTPVGTAEDFTVKIANDLGVLARRQRGSISPSGRPIGVYAE